MGARDSNSDERFARGRFGALGGGRSVRALTCDGVPHAFLPLQVCGYPAAQ